MDSTDFRNSESLQPGPAVLFLADLVVETPVDGSYDEASATWSDREFRLAGPKKHNEAM